MGLHATLYGGRERDREVDLDAKVVKLLTDANLLWEAHAVLLNLKRKQQDSADAVVKVARDRKDAELRDATLQMKKEIKASADQLAKSLADFGVRIAAA